MNNLTNLHTLAITKVKRMAMHPDPTRISRPALFLVLFYLLATSARAQEQAYFPDPNPAIQQRIAEWQDLKFGVLFHWGPYSQWGIVESWSLCPEDLSWATGARKAPFAGDYNEYRKTYEALQYSFNPRQFNPTHWAEAARKAGMRYVVITTKHHDGFCMWDTKFTDYRITDPKTPFSTDPRSNVIREVFDAFRKEGLWTGAYFSKPDWHSDYYWWKKFPPADRNANYSITKYPEQWAKFVEYTHNQIDELMSDYGKVDILWLDGGWVRKKTDAEIQQELLEKYEGSRWARNAQSQDIDMEGLVRKARAKQPQLIVVDRAVPGPHQNYLTPEQHIPENGLPYPWETCMTMATSWSHVPNDVYKSKAEILRKLVDIVSKGGNYLLNIGPRPDGELDPTAYQRLEEIGAWMDVHGKSIYNTRPYQVWHEGEHIRFTQSKDGKRVYVFFLETPPAADVVIESLSLRPGDTLSMLENGQAIKWKAGENGILLRLPTSFMQSVHPVRVLEVKRAE